MPLSLLQLDLQPEAKVLMSVQYFLEDGGKTSMVAGATPVARSGAELALMLKESAPVGIWGHSGGPEAGAALNGLGLTLPYGS